MKINLGFKIDPYEAFFVTIVLVVLSLLFSVMKDVILLDPNGVWQFVVASLFGTAIMMNLGDQKASAKELFWGWVIMVVGCTAMAYLGSFILWMVR